MNIADVIAQHAGMSTPALAGLWAVRCDLAPDGSDTYVVTTWNVPGVAAPTSAQIAAGLAAPPTSADLAAYASAKQVALRDGGITVNVGTASAPLQVDVASDVDGTRLVSTKVQMIGLAAAAGQAPPSFNWQNNDGTWLTLSAAQLQAIGLALPTFHQATYDALKPIASAIADGTITSTAGVDAASWPAAAA